MWSIHNVEGCSTTSCHGMVRAVGRGTSVIRAWDWQSEGITVWGCTDRPCSDLDTGQSPGCIGVWTRTCSLSMCSRESRDPASQSEFFVPVSHLQTFNWLYCYRQLTVSTVVSAIAVFTLVDNLNMPSRLHFVQWPKYKLKPCHQARIRPVSLQNCGKLEVGLLHVAGVFQKRH